MSSLQFLLKDVEIMILSKTGDFELVNDYYLELLKIIKTLGNDRRNDIKTGLTRDRIVAFTYMIQEIRAICSNISLTVSQMNELTKDIDLEKLDEMMPYMPSFDNIEIKDEYIEEAVDIDIKKQFRNCLAHAGYKIVIENAKPIKEDLEKEGLELSYEDIYIEVENQYIKGKIPYKDFVQFGIQYGVLRSIFAKDPIVFYKMEPRFASLKNTSILNNALNSIKKVQFIPAESDEENAIEPEEILSLCVHKYGANMSNIEDLASRFRNYEEFCDITKYKYIERGLTEDEKDFIRKYCSYLGFNKMEEITSNKQINEGFFQDVIESSLANRVVPGLNTMFSITLQAAFNATVTPELTPDIITSLELLRKNYSFVLLQYEAPILYSNMLLGMAYYNFDFIREANEANRKSGEKYFRFKDIKIKGQYRSRDDCVKSKNYMQEEISAKEEKESSLKRILKAIRGKILSNNVFIGEEKRVQMQAETERIFAQNSDINVENILEKIVTKTYSNSIDNMNLEKVRNVVKTFFNNTYNPREMSSEDQQILKDILNTTETYGKNTEGFPLTELDDSVLELENQIIERNYKYEDTSEFFRYLRNCIAHGRYKIDYKDALTSRRLEKIKFHFEDYDVDENQNPIKVFEYDVKAGELMSMINDYRKTILAQMKDDSYSQELFKKKTDRGVENMPELV